MMRSTPPGPNAARRVLVVDDHPIVRQGVRLLLESEADLEVCGEAEDLPSALRVAAATSPDVAIVDLALPGPGGLELIRALRDAHPHLVALVLSMHEERIYAERALRAGAHGYVSKQEAPGELVRAIRRILAGERFLTERAASHVLARIAGDRCRDASAMDRLSDREVEVFRLIGNGLGTRQIAEMLHLSVKTVESHRAGIKQKLGLRSGIELVRQAVRSLEPA
jgi:DNA-binding NarL/FixJ family response regulator